ncbi:zinc finger BED domain-containing protein RICESLEEPER 2-like [Setaria viridis]|uniref:zinc finger BED domain-containing protein RICESLEEPER 2-like n=1 Tax=Setaria viridis TaxID=4556 RepID=UPI003B3B950F
MEDSDVEVVRSEAEGEEKNEEQNKNEEQEKDQKKEAKKRKAMAPRSDVWDSYHKILVGDVLKKAKCKYCSRELNCHSKKNANAIPYEKAFERYKDDDPYYQLDLEGQNMPGVPVKSDWEKAKKMAEFLEHFYELTLRVSATQHVTSHTYFHEIADVLILLREWCQSCDSIRKDMGKRMLTKYYKYWGDKKEDMLNLVIFFCVAIDPRYKLSDYTKMATLEMFGHEIGQELWAVVNKSFHALFEEYKNLYAPSGKSQHTTDSEQAPEKSKRLMRSVIAQKMRLDGGGNGTTKSELEKYFAEENEEDKKDFEILEWWKDNAHRFPILSHMARDLLAIPISTVASESAFSTGGRVLDDFRSSLTPIMVERLICTQDWLRRSTTLSVEEDPEELAKIEEALTHVEEDIGGFSLTISPKSTTNAKSTKPSPA